MMIAPSGPGLRLLIVILPPRACTRIACRSAAWPKTQILQIEKRKTDNNNLSLWGHIEILKKWKVYTLLKGKLKAILAWEATPHISG